MSLKNSLCAFCLVVLTTLFTSCLGGNESDDILLIDAQIYSFSVSSDSISAVNSAVFYIDQINGLIFNKDSLPFGTQINQKIIASFSGGGSSNGVYSGLAGVLNVTDLANNDSTWFSSNDSIDLSSPMQIRTYALDGATTKSYLIKLNVHQMDPDSIQYNQVATGVAALTQEETYTVRLGNVFYAYSKVSGGGIKLSTSSDAINWTEATVSGLPDDINLRSIQAYSGGYGNYFANTPEGRWFSSLDGKKWDEMNFDYPVIAILGTLGASPTQNKSLTFIVKKNNQLVFASSSNLKDWRYGNVVPDNFPVSGFSAVSFLMSQKERVNVIGGVTASGVLLNTCWSTTDGLYWAEMTKNTQQSFPVLDGANAFYYNNAIFLINGKLADNTYNLHTYNSIDGGVTWQLAPTKYYLPSTELDEYLIAKSLAETGELPVPPDRPDNFIFYTLRYASSTCVDENNFIYIFGGKNDGILSDIWKGRINKLATE